MLWLITYRNNTLRTERTLRVRAKKRSGAEKLARLLRLIGEHVIAIVEEMNS